MPPIKTKKQHHFSGTFLQIRPKITANGRAAGGSNVTLWRVLSGRRSQENEWDDRCTQFGFPTTCFQGTISRVERRSSHRNTRVCAGDLEIRSHSPKPMTDRLPWSSKVSEMISPGSSAGAGGSVLALSSLSLLFSEMVQYSLARVAGTGELESRLIAMVVDSSTAAWSESPAEIAISRSGRTSWRASVGSVLVPRRDGSVDDGQRVDSAYSYASGEVDAQALVGSGFNPNLHSHQRLAGKRSQLGMELPASVCSLG